MIERISSVMQDGNRRFPLKYRRMINCLADRFGYVRNTYLLGKPMQTPGTELLKFFIMNLNVVRLDEYSSDIERYTEVIKFFKLNYLQSFDPVRNGSIKGGKWISSSATGGIPPPEIILNVDSAAPIMSLPFDKPWEDWQHLRGIRIVYHDSLELIERFTTSMLEFKHQKPSFMVMALDVSILLFKYYKYWKNCLESGIQANVNEFIKRYEYANFFDDLLNIWTLNLLTLIAKNPSAPTTDILEQLRVPPRVCTRSMLTQGIDGIKEFLPLVSQGQFKPQDFLETRWFLNTSIRERLDLLDKWCTLPDNRQYLWCNAVLWLPYIHLILLLTNLFPDGMVNQLIKNRCTQLYVNKFKYANMPGMTNSEVLKTFIEKVETDIEQHLDKQNPVTDQR